MASVRPWNELSALMTTCLVVPCVPPPDQRRANFSAHSLASAPELAKKTCPPAWPVPPLIRRSMVSATSGPIVFP